jgi:hypothetical protein
MHGFRLLARRYRRVADSADDSQYEAPSGARLDADNHVG